MYIMYIYIYIYIYIHRFNLFCSCDTDVETNTHETNKSLQCPLFSSEIYSLGKTSSDISANTFILNAAMKYIISTNRFEENLFLVSCNLLP